MFTSCEVSSSARSGLRIGLQLAVLAGAGVGLAGAQGVSPAGATLQGGISAFQTASVPAFVSPSRGLEEGYSSSATEYDATGAAQTQLASAETSFKLPGAEMQYGRRRRYGAPRYRGGNTNPDGSEKYTVYAGAGLAAPTGDNFNYATASWGFQVGGGRNFNQRFGTMLEFDYDHFGMTGDTLTNQQNLYDYIINYYQPGSGDAAAGLDGNSHIWSITLDPTYTFKHGEGLGAYVIGGVGFYHKVANFTLPQEGSYCDYYGFCYDVVANQVVDHYTSNAAGLNGGIGFTYKFSRFANERFYGEVRYVYMFNSPKPGVTYATVNQGNNVSVANDFPQNSQRTGYIPVKFGIRF